MSTISMEDMNYLAQQSSERINMILAGMTALMNDTDNKVEALESQNWFQRMAKTIIGKNKMTKNEIQQNHDKLNAYMSEAIAELYNRNCIDQAVMMSLGTQINELYADHVQLKQMLGAFVSKLNVKIDSVDNFHILNTEIEQGVYSEYAPIVAMCKIMAQFDNRVLDEERKIDILKRSMEAENIINDEEVPLANYLMTIADVPVDEIGAIYLELGTIRNNFLANIMLKTIEQYHFLPDMARKMKKKENIVANVIQSEELDGSVTLASSYVFEEFVNSKLDAKNGFMTIEVVPEETEGNPSLIVSEHVELIDKTPDELFQKGIEEYENKNYELAVQYYIKAAELENSEAQNRLALCYDTGTGIEENKIEAFKWFMKAARQEYAPAQYNVALCYFLGDGVNIDENEGLIWLKKAAEQGYESAIQELAAREEVEHKNYYIKQDTYKLIKGMCSTYAMLHDEYNYVSNTKIEQTLGIFGEEIYLVHDASLLKNGKNGFAITESGIYCRRFLENWTRHVSFEELINTQTIYEKDSYIYADEDTLAYLPSGSRTTLRYLTELFEKIRMYVAMDFDNYDFM